MLRSRYHLVVVFVLALLLRTIAFLAFAGTPFTRVLVGDSKGYLASAVELTSGDLGVFFQSAPLYPLLLAAGRMFTEQLWTPLALLQIVVSSLACVAIAWSSAEIFPADRAAPWIAGTLAAIYGPWIYFDLELLPASLATSLLALSLAVGLHPAGRARSLSAGLLVGAAALLAPALVLVGVAIAFRAAMGPRGRIDRPSLIRGATVLLGVGLMVAPVTLHNAMSGDLVAISSNAGVNAFIGNNPEATGAFFLPPESGLDGARLEQSARRVAERAAGRPLSPSAVSSYWMGRARSFAADEPLRFLRLLGRKAALTVNHYEIPNHLNFQFVTDRFLPGLGWALPFWILFPLFGLGTLAAAATKSRGASLLFVATLLCLFVPVLFFATARYRLPAAAPMLILAGGGPTWLMLAIGRRRFVRAAGALMLLVALGWSTRVPLVREGDYSFDHLLLGDAHWKLDRLDEAIVEFKLSVETAPVDHGARIWLAQVLEQRGNLREAATVLDAQVAAHPQDATAWAALARLRSAELRPIGPQAPGTDFEIAQGYILRQDLDDAERFLRRAIERDPTHVRAMIELAYVRTRAKDLTGAFAWLERAVRLAPSDLEIWKDLARIYHRAGYDDAARQAIEHAITLEPSDPELQEVMDLLGED